MDHKSQEYLGIDVGNQWVGLARGGSLARLAQPLKSISAANAVPELAEFVKTNRVDGIVVGLPRNLSGEDTGQTGLVREWVERAKDHISLPFYWQDEALTSQEAINQTQKGKSPADEHAVAAAIFLQDFLNASESDRVAA